VRYSLAGCLACIEQKDEAREHLEKILEMDPDSADAKEMLEQLQS